LVPYVAPVPPAPDWSDVSTKPTAREADIFARPDSSGTALFMQSGMMPALPSAPMLAPNTGLSPVNEAAAEPSLVVRRDDESSRLDRWSQQAADQFRQNDLQNEIEARRLGAADRPVRRDLRALSGLSPVPPPAFSTPAVGPPTPSVPPVPPVPYLESARYWGAAPALASASEALPWGSGAYPVPASAAPSERLAPDGPILKPRTREPRRVPPSGTPEYDAQGLPIGPPGVDINANMELARKNWPNGFWFYNQVKSRGPWDFKHHFGSQYEDYGNFHYGVVAKAFGFPDPIIYNEAGIAQNIGPTAEPNGRWGRPASRWSYIFPLADEGVPPYGDQPRDRYWIARAIEHYNANHRIMPRDMRGLMMNRR
jgi:hypothetical protein